jgi:hypothetical protein
MRKKLRRDDKSGGRDGKEILDEECKKEQNLHIRGEAETIFKTSRMIEQ